ncbi:MAG: large conductance mechanosensitive channel protein MscL [Planctomycetota bacterium]
MTEAGTGGLPVLQLQQPTAIIAAMITKRWPVKPIANLLEEFQNFAVKGNVVDLAVGVIIGAAFGAVVTSLVENVLMPPLGYVIGGVDFSELAIPLADDSPERVAEIEAQIAAIKAGEVRGDLKTQEAALKVAKEGVAVKYGLFINACIRFLIQAMAVFLVVRTMNRLLREKEEAAKQPGLEQKPALSTQERLLTDIRDLLASGTQPEPAKPAPGPQTS